MNHDFTRLKNEFSKIEIELDENAIERFDRYYEMLIEKNKVMNLTAITEFEDVVMKHFFDSVYLFRFMNLKERINIIDVGTGAGFPGIPLKIVFPQLDITLLDSLNKRVGFLNEVIDALELENINAIHGRAEDIARDNEFRGKFDLCVSRAVANLSTLSEYCLPFVKNGGFFVSYKSGEVEEEIKNSKSAIYLLGGKLNRVETFSYDDNNRSFVIIDKVSNTSSKYPRKAGLPSKKPL